MRSIYHWIIGDQLSPEDNLHEWSRIKLFINISVTLFVIGLLVSVVAIIVGTYPVLIPGLGNTVLAGIALMFLKFRMIKVAETFYFSSLFILLFGNLIFNEGTMHAGSPFWVMLLNILVTYIMGIRWGVVFMSLSVLGFSYYMVEVFPHTLEIVNSLPAATYYSVIHETLIALFLLGYVLYIILSTSKRSDEILKQKNAALTERNRIIVKNDEEKTVMLKEIHHRVKNNLQVIISLMRLQMSNQTDEENKKYQEMINRVLTMALIHEKIYQSEDLSQIMLKQYFNDLTEDLLQSYQLDTEVELDLKIEIDKIAMKSLVPVALIFNELFSNSLKHAFPEMSKGQVKFHLYSLGDNKVGMVYIDNGQWKEPVNDSSLGLELVRSLTSQLDGELNFKTTPETSFIFELEVDGF